MEDEMMNHFVILHPYPTYDQMIKKIQEVPNVLTALDMFAEYGEPNHEWCKTIYENPSDESKIIEMGKKIYTRGGEQAMLWNHKVLSCMSPLACSTNPVIGSHAAWVGHCWNGIGGWTA